MACCGQHGSPGGVGRDRKGRVPWRLVMPGYLENPSWVSGQSGFSLLGPAGLCPGLSDGLICSFLTISLTPASGYREGEASRDTVPEPRGFPREELRASRMSANGATGSWPRTSVGPEALTSRPRSCRMEDCP